MKSEGENFETFLSALDEAVLAQVKIDQVNEYSGTQFQALVLKIAKEICIPFGFSPDQISGTGVGDFPDIVVAEKYGIEVKVTKDDNWISLGNSINESRRVLSVEHVYLFFGKMGGTREIRHRKYEEASAAIKSTHYPRYVVNMETPDGESIFARLGLSYQDFLRLEGIERIRKLKSYLRSTLPTGEVLWWMDSDALPAPGQLADGILRNLNRLSIDEKSRFRRMCMILTPQIFGNSGSKYNDAAIVLAKEFQAVTGNLRDFFSAGGRGAIRLEDGEELEVSRMVYLLCVEAHEIARLLESQHEDTIVDFWQLDPGVSKRVEVFAGYLDQHSSFLHKELTLGDVFLAQLKIT